MARILAAAFAVALLVASSIGAPAQAQTKTYVRDPVATADYIAGGRRTRAELKREIAKAQDACDRAAWRKAVEAWEEEITYMARTLREVTPAGEHAEDIKRQLDNELLYLATGAGGYPDFKYCPPSIVQSIPDPEPPVRKPVVAPLPEGVSRPVLAPLEDPKIPTSFCSQTEKVNFLNAVYNPAAATALSNSQKAQIYSAQLNGLFTIYMRNEGGPIWKAIQGEMAAYTPIAAGAYGQSTRINALYAAIMAVPIEPCAQPVENEAVAVPATGQPLTPVNDPAPSSKPGKPDCPPEQRRKSIVVGPNGKVGSGARLKAKAASTALGIAGGLLGGALPGGGGGGGGGGSSGPPTVVCKIKDGEMTVFNDPATGISLKIGAKRAGGTVVVFSEIAKSPDNGTFQTAFLENPQGEAMAPADVGICDLWGEWKLTVSWTKTTYVDGQVVKRESGGWQKAGRFAVPGVLSAVDRPDGLWKQLGFSNASHGARKIAAQYKLPQGGGPVDAIIHVTRPSGDPVTTVPFALRMVEGPNGFTFTKAPTVACPPPESILDDVGDSVPPPESLLDDIGGTSPLTPATPGGQPAIPSAPPPSGGPTTTRPKEGGQPVTDVVALDKEFDDNRFNDEAMKAALEKSKLTYKKGCQDLTGEFLFRERKDRWIARLRERLAKLKAIVPTGKFADSIREAVEAETARTEAVLKEAREMETYCPVPGFEGWPGTTLDPDAKPAAPSTPPPPGGKAPDPGDKAPESILDDVDESPPVIG